MEPEEYWVVEVREEPNLLLSLPGYRRRFTFQGEDAAIQAWECWTAAIDHGFSATAHAAKTGKVLVLDG